MKCEYCSTMQHPDCTHFRAGKTKRDHESGVWSNRFGNREARQNWQKTGGAFPRGSCNGKKNRFVT